MAKKFVFNTSDYILYLLQHLEPKQSGKIKLNKIAFFVEFGYIHKTGNPLSATAYAGINLGPIINNYKLILQEMQQKGLIKIDGNCLRLLKDPKVEVPGEISQVIDPLIAKYSQLSDTELVKLSHLTDSYQITTQNSQTMGKKINKNLASLESFYDEESCEDDIDENKLPSIAKEHLIPYEI